MNNDKSFFLIKILIPLQILLAGLRVTGEIDWNWRIVFLPLALYVFFNILIVISAILLVAGRFKKKGR